MKIVRITLVASLVLAMVTAVADPQYGDITAAVRASGYAPTVSSVPETGQAGSCKNTGLFDGLCSYADAGYPTAGQRFFFQKSASSSFTLDYAVPDSFCPGEDIVVTALVFAVGRSSNSGGSTTYFTNYDKRMPKTWSLEGSNDGGSTWSTIAAASSFTRYTLHQSGGFDDVYDGVCDIANKTSYRKYRVMVTDNTGDATYMTQLTEVRFFGFYGGTYEYTPVKTDLTAMARRADGSTSFAASAPNLTPYSTAMTIDKAFDGLCTSGGNDRFLATADSTSAALSDSGAIIEYEFTEAFANNGDVVVTGYTLDTYTGHGSALQRMPKNWVFEAYDEANSAWVQLDSYAGFVQWETHTVDGCDQYLLDFSFANSASYRKYRFRITALNMTSSPQVQFSEIRLHGYAGKGIAGTVGLKGEGHPIDITSWGRQYFSPLTGRSDCAAVSSSPTQGTLNLWDGLFSQNYVLYTLNENQFPFAMTYGIPSDYYAGADFIVTNYTISARADLGNRDNRMPYNWHLEGFSDAEQRWIVVDRRAGYDSWEADSSKNRIYAQFSCPSNGCAYRQYRLKVLAVKAKSNTSWQLALQEIEFQGVWGHGLGDAPPAPQGLLLLLR